MMQRAWSRFAIKSLNDELRILEGVATTPTPDRMSDVVEPLGAEFTLPLPFLWQHNSEQPIGHVTAAKPTKDGIPVTIELVKTDEPGKLKDRLDEAWQSIKLGLVRGLSIGFAPLESSYIEKTGGIHFLKYLLLEISAVTVAANAEASIAVIRSCDSRMIRLSKNRPMIRLSKNRPMIRLSKNRPVIRLAAKNRPVIRLSKNRPVIRLAAKNRPMIRLSKNRPVIRLPQQ
jgi:HK97 family phage prohead protease